MEIIERFITNNDNYKNNRKITVQGLMLHSVGTPQPNAEVFVRVFNNPRPNGRQVGVHAFFGPDGRVFQTLPWEHRAWHCGSGAKGSGNNTHIGVEMTEPNTIKYIGGSRFEDKNPEHTKEFVLGTYKTAVDLFAHLCKQFRLDPLAEGVIISHAEGHRLGIASNHGDPVHLWRGYALTMDGFRQNVKQTMGSGSEHPTKTQVTAEELEILQRITHAEARGEDEKGQILVVNVIMNRVKSKGFPNTIKEVVFQPNQFEPTRNGAYERAVVMPTVIAAVNKALQGADYSNGATFFRSLRGLSPDSWHETRLKKLFDHGGHRFYA